MLHSSPLNSFPGCLNRMASSHKKLKADNLETAAELRRFGGAESGRQAICGMMFARMPRAKSNQHAIAVVVPPPEPAPTPEIRDWALVELFGHQRIVGYVSQQTFPGGVLFRVDVPDLLKEGKKIREGFTRYFGLSAIYSITPCTETMVRAMLPGIDGTPGDARPMSLDSFSRHRDYEDGDR
jgi:hypothetical protein